MKTHLCHLRATVDLWGDGQIKCQTNCGFKTDLLIKKWNKRNLKETLCLFGISGIRNS